MVQDGAALFAFSVLLVPTGVIGLDMQEPMHAKVGQGFHLHPLANRKKIDGEQK